jgi:hypothetical protein
LHAPGQPEHAYCVEGDAQYVPNTGSVKPPDAGHVQFPVSLYGVGCVVHTVAASFQALHHDELGTSRVHAARMRES